MSNHVRPVRLPVVDIVRTRNWYVRVLGFVIDHEVDDDGVLTWSALHDPLGTVFLGLFLDRPRPEMVVPGAEPVVLTVPTEDSLAAWQRRLDQIGEPHTGLTTSNDLVLLGGLVDPDGVHVRLSCNTPRDRAARPDAEAL